MRRRPPPWRPLKLAACFALVGVFVAFLCHHHQTVQLANCATAPLPPIPISGKQAPEGQVKSIVNEAQRLPTLQTWPGQTNDNNKGNKPAQKRQQQVKSKSKVKAIQNAQQAAPVVLAASQPQQQQQATGSSQLQKNQNGGGGGNLWRPTKSFRRPQQQSDDSYQSQPSGQMIDASSNNIPNGNIEQGQQINNDNDQSVSNESGGGGLQVSITPRVSLVRVPVESNAILKCLISAQTNKFQRPFKVAWSRYRHDENDFEQIEWESYDSSETRLLGVNQQADLADSNRTPNVNGDPSSLSMSQRNKRQTSTQHRTFLKDENDKFAATFAALETGSNNTSSSETSFNPPALVDRQQQLRNFLARSRQETNIISELLIEATLSISPVKASDNASYFCTAVDGRQTSASSSSIELQQNQQAQIDLLALARPEVRLERIQPARDSKSALVVWSVLSDGNTPIHKTILMVRNDSIAPTSLVASNNNNNKFSKFQKESQLHNQESQDIQQQGQLASSSVVLDGDYNQWQRNEIYADGMPLFEDQEEFSSGGSGGIGQEEAEQFAGATGNQNDNDDVVRADVDVTSINLSSGGGGESNFNFNQTTSQRRRRPPSFEQQQANNNNNNNNKRANRQRGRRRKWRPEMRRGYNLTSLLPGVTYQLRLAALNDMGQSEWSQLLATMPNEIPAQISDIVVLGTTNDSITIGWRRPPYDNAKTIRYEMQLFDLNQTMTLDANTNITSGSGSGSSGQQRTNFMFHFVSLTPGTEYHFHIRACSKAGCSAYSTPKLLASTLDGEPDEPLDVELTCKLSSSSSFDQGQSQGQANNAIQVSWLPPSQARGRLANYSVQLQGQARYRNQSGQWTSDEWQTIFETSDNHTLSLDTSNLQAAQQTATGISFQLMPNSNYSARVCANNRLRKCGKLSALSSKAQCHTQAELPRELPASIKLQLKQIQTTQVGQTKPAAETLVLELPFISLRNGSIDCLQVMLIRLPRAFEETRRALSEFLPDDPADLKLHDYLELLSSDATSSPEDAVKDLSDPDQATSTPGVKLLSETKSESAQAYLAEELDPINQSATSEELAVGLKQIMLGDGVQSSCAQLWAKLKTRETNTGSGQLDRDNSSRPQAIDGALLAQTHYTGFLRLVQVRPSSSQYFANQQQQTIVNGRKSLVKRTRRQVLVAGGQVEVLTKYSNYFSPVKTGQHVPEVSVESLIANDEFQQQQQQRRRLINGNGNLAIDSTTMQDTTSGGESFDRFCDENKLTVELLNKLGTDKPCRLAMSALDGLWSGSKSAFKATTSFLAEHLKLASALNSRSNVSQAAAPLQLLEIGLLVFVASLLMLFAVYLLSLPATLRRKRRIKLKKRLEQHEAAAAANVANSSKSGGGGGANLLISDEQHSSNINQPQIHPPNLAALASSLGYHQVEPGDMMQVDQQQQANRVSECPIHSSPRQVQQQQQQAAVDGVQRPELNDNSVDQEQDEQYQQEQQMYAMHQDDGASRRQSVHVCQAGNELTNNNKQLMQADYLDDHSHSHHLEHRFANDNLRHHRHSTCQLDSSLITNNPQPLAIMAGELEGRNCRTMRRTHHNNNQQSQLANGLTDPQLVGHYHRQQQAMVGSANYNQPTAMQQHQSYSNMTMQHDTALALAKKINKSIPLSLFQAVLECRLKNNWLREEYEQLARLSSQQANNNHTLTKVNLDGRHIRLRPQLIVSRDDSVSALISGHDKYDASLIKLQLPQAHNYQPPPATNGDSTIAPPVQLEREFICAKSPLDADSVWDFWRLVYEREVGSLVMLTPNEDSHTGELRCAQYWPTCDNEETTILSPCNEFVQQSTILPAKFKIRQETLTNFEPPPPDCLDSNPNSINSFRADEFKIRRLTLLVMATRASENEHTSATTPTTSGDELLDNTNSKSHQASNGVKGHSQAATNGSGGGGGGGGNSRQEEDGLTGDEESLVIVERTLLHFQFLHWNASSSSNQMRLIKFVELVNERHSRQVQQQASPGAHWQQSSAHSPILVHCANGIGRSGLFTAMSFVIDDLSAKLSTMSMVRTNSQHHQQQMAAKLNLFQLVSKLRNQRDMLLSPYRFYELLYQLTTRCIPAHHHHNHQQHHNHHLQQQQQNVLVRDHTVATIGRQVHS